MLHKINNTIQALLVLLVCILSVAFVANEVGFNFWKVIIVLATLLAILFTIAWLLGRGDKLPPQDGI